MITQPPTPQRVAIISATFHHERSYQENIWAESLADWGVEVTVYAPVDQATSGSTVTFIVDTPQGASYQVALIPSTILPRNSVLSDALADHVVDARPDLCVWFGAVMYFGRGLYLDPRLAEVPVITVYSLSRRGRHPFQWYGRGHSWSARAKSLAFQVLRAPILARSLSRAQLTIANTPECTDIIRQYIWGDDRVSWACKHVEIPLGFCPHTFRYRPRMRAQAREALSLRDNDVTVLFSTRFAPDKWPALNSCFQAVEQGFQQALELINGSEELTHLSDSQAPRLHMIWIGADESAVTAQMRDVLREAQDPGQHHLISFQTRERLATWYHTADLILFPQPSISVQEALGTGAQVLCPPDPSLDHLARYPVRIERQDVERWPEHIARLCVEMLKERARQHTGNSCAEDARAEAAKGALDLAYPNLIKTALFELERRLG